MEDHEKQNVNESSSKLSVFVAGAPSGIHSSTLVRYFGIFGKVVGAHSFTKVHKSHTINNAKTSNFVVRVADRQTYNTILAYSGHELLGRSLICSEYLTGKELILKNSEANKRRVILKQVPLELNENEVRDYLKKHFGRVEFFYPYKPESGQIGRSEMANKRYRTYNVMFVEKKSAREITSYSHLYIGDFSRILIEKFRHKNCKKVQALSLECIQRDEYESKQEQNIGLVSEKIIKKCKSFPFSIYEREVPISDTDGKPAIAEVAVIYRSLNEHTIKGMKTKDICRFALDLFECTHHCRPRSKVYFLLRQQYTHYLKSFSTSFSNFADSNIRLNT